MNNNFFKPIMIIDSEKVAKAIQGAIQLYDIIVKYMERKELSPIEFAVLVTHIIEYRVRQPEECVGCEAKPYCDEIVSILEQEKINPNQMPFPYAYKR